MIMDYWVELKTLCENEIDKPVTGNSTLTVTKEKHFADNMFDLSLIWSEPSNDDLAGETYPLPVSRSVRVMSDRLNQKIPDMFRSFRNRVDFTGTVESISLRENTDQKNEFISSSFALCFDLDRLQPTSLLGSTCLDYTVELGEEKDLHFSSDQVVDSQIIYSDFEECTVSSVNARIRTKNPEKFFEDVDTMNEIRDRLNDAEIDAADSYVVPFVLNREDIPPVYRTLLEDTLRSFVESNLSTSLDYVLEGESIYTINGTVRDTDYMFSKPEFAYYDYDEDESIYCRIHVDPEEIVDMEL